MLKSISEFFFFSSVASTEIKMLWLCCRSITQPRFFFLITAFSLLSAVPLERSTGPRGDPVTPEKAKHKFDRRTREKEEMESQREQVIWRLEKLLGDTCSNREMAGGCHPPSDSICTEDFVTRFRDEMVEPALPESEMKEQETEEETEGTEISDCDSFQAGKKQKRVHLTEEREETVTDEDTEADPYSESKNICERQELEKCFSDSLEVNRTCDGAGAGEGHETPQTRGESVTSKYFDFNIFVHKWVSPTSWIYLIWIL